MLWYETMKTKNVQKQIGQLIRKVGGRSPTAERLDITVRYIKMLQNGRECSSALAKIIDFALLD